MTSGRESRACLFAHDAARAARDRARLLQHFGEGVRTGMVVEPLKLERGPAQKLSKHPLDQYAWKWSEITGKYVGCPHWSVAAAAVLESRGRSFPQKSLQALSKEVSRKVNYATRILHEHVFPRRDWIQLMESNAQDLRNVNADELRDLMNRYCIACVVTGAEDDEVRGRAANRANPWLRYSGTSIRLVENPAWSDRHRQWIEEARLA